MVLPYTISKSTRQHKKYMATFSNGKTVHFGDNRYQQYKDSALGIYTKLNHGDAERRRRYYMRHGKAKKYSAKWFSHKYLW